MCGHAKRRRLTAVLAVALVVGAGVAGVGSMVDVAGGQEGSETLYVDATPATSCSPEDVEPYSNIQDAVDAANAGDTVVVCGGGRTYDAGVTVDKQLTIEGNTSDGPVVLDSGSTETAIAVGSSADGTVIDGLRIRSYRGAGVSVGSASDVTVRNTVFRRISGPAIDVTDANNVSARGIDVAEGQGGVSTERTTGVAVTESTFDDISGAAIDLRGSAGVLVRDVRVSDTEGGLTVESATDVTVTDSTFDEVDGPGVRLVNVDGALVDGVTVENSPEGVAVSVTDGREISDVTVRNTTVRDGVDGVRVEVLDAGTELSDLTLSGLDVSETDRGAGVFAADDSAVTGVTVEGSTMSDIGTRAVDISAADGVPRIRDVMLRDLTLDGSGSAEGVRVAAEGGGLLRNLTLRDSSIESHEAGVVVVDRAVVGDVNVFGNRIVESGTGVRIDGETNTPFENVGVRGNLVAESDDVGVLVTDGTDPSGVRVTRNVVRDNGVGVTNDGESELAAWLNYWGTDAGPSGDDVSGNVRSDPWLGQDACSEAGLRSVVDGSFELPEESVDLAEIQSFCAWDRAPLALRPDPGNAATRVDNLNLSYDLPGTDGPVPADRPEVAIYEQDESFELRFGAGGTDTSRFAGGDAQLIVLRDRFDSNASFDVSFDDERGETVLRTGVDSATVRDLPPLDGDGELDYSFEPSAPGSYTFVLVTSGFGSGVENVSGASEIRLDGGASVVGFDTVVVRETAASADPNSASYPAGGDVGFDLNSGLGGGTTDHALLLYDESQYRNASATVRVDATAAEVIAGEIQPGDVTVESSVGRVNGFYRAATEFSALGVEVEARDDSGPVDPSPFVGLGMRQHDVTSVDVAGAEGSTPLNGSIVVVSEGSDTTATVETFANFSTGTYRYVYVATQGRATSSATGTVDITTPPSTATPTPTPTPAPSTPTPTDPSDPSPSPTTTPTPTPDDVDGGGGGGGGGGGAGPSGEVEIEGFELLNETVEVGQPVVVRVALANFDPVRGRITLDLATEGTVLVERTVAVGASTERTVFLGTRFGTPGTYPLALNDDPIDSLTVIDTPTGTPTAGMEPTPTGSPAAGGGPTSPTATAGRDPTTATASAGPGADGTPALGPPPASRTETVVALGMTLLLLYGVGVAVYVLREYPPAEL
jgi:hypothetical protein